MFSSFIRDPFDLMNDSFFAPFGRSGTAGWGNRPRWGQGLLTGSAPSGQQGQSDVSGGGGGGALQPAVNAGVWDFGRYLQEPVALNLVEKDDRYEMTVHPPQDLKPEELRVEIRNGVLTVHGEHREKSQDKTRGATRTRRSYQQFSRSIALPDNVDENDVKASLGSDQRNLQIILPKHEKTATRRIQITGVSQDDTSPQQASSGSSSEQKTATTDPTQTTTTQS